ncbi:hypothetical protein [Anabaena sp. UHCC 0399]|uniref:hypothetical protein n=1 Tax=Anabaena sp. UHCC 0399 TaxID=3110238 RepID=UPI002B2141E9|nr:hypothetical protein [Anabaena sp. UHCC 0399]MEA5567513.1 hypothetical protein [Anabaena sp. UHCC 0399]
MSVEDKHLDVLQNIEFVIMQVYQERPDLIDAEVMTAIESLIRVYSAEAQGRSGASRPIRGISAQVTEQVKAICELRLGRTSISGNAIQPLDEQMTPKTVTEIVDCLKRIQSSIKLWTNKGGRQGYLNFIKQFFQSR